MRRTESGQRGPEGDGEGPWNFHYNTQHQVGVGKGIGDGAKRLTARQHWDRGLAGDETHQGRQHTRDFGLKGM